MPEHQELDDMEEEEREAVKQMQEEKKKEQMLVRPFIDNPISELDFRNEYKAG